MNFTLADLQAELKALAPGAACCIHHDTFAGLFPSGEPDDNARKAAFDFAKANGCTISNRPSENLLCFVKDS
jgi:hypothetical protein